eukprot:TRINITY_DN8896_c1_g1_i1.p1 TRINITY_DN8896_c1_g1~~TRINITY_DN8896_c1_g1_i1.p1  ORF type:complete len:263 (-),score=40.51 TRINITY_DN8896_c1_g1_i1:322-1110(-)
MQGSNSKLTLIAGSVVLFSRAYRLRQTEEGCECKHPRDLPNLKSGLSFSFVKCNKSYADKNGECLVADLISCGKNNDEYGRCLFPGDYGASCKKHEMPSPLCYDITTGKPLPPSRRKAYCDTPWCYVDVCTCKSAEGQSLSQCCSGTADDNASGDNKIPAAGIFISYEACRSDGGKDVSIGEEHQIAPSTAKLSATKPYCNMKFITEFCNGSVADEQSATCSNLATTTTPAATTTKSNGAVRSKMPLLAVFFPSLCAGALLA